jgi:predicted nucleic acid-binding protein
MIPSIRKTSVIVDASSLVDAVLGDIEVLARLPQHQLNAPATVDAEVLHALRRKWLAKLVTDFEAVTAIETFVQIEITRHAVQPLVSRMWSLRHNITAYDAGYVALAESLSLPLLTRDWRLAHSAGHAAAIEYIA